MQLPDGLTLEGWDRIVFLRRMHAAIDGEYFSTCGLQHCRRAVLGDDGMSESTREQRDELEAFHCVNYKDMPPGGATMLIERAAAFVGVDVELAPAKSDVPTASDGPESGATARGVHWDRILFIALAFMLLGAAIMFIILEKHRNTKLQRESHSRLTELSSLSLGPALDAHPKARVSVPEGDTEDAGASSVFMRMNTSCNDLRLRRARPAFKAILGQE